MRYNDLLNETAAPAALNEYGKHGHPGYGRSIFRQAYYRSFVNDLVGMHDAHIREFITQWLADILAKDNPKFNTRMFVDAVEQGKHFNVPSVTFQQRHFYYLAGEIANIGDMHAREFVADYFAKVAGRTNPNFKRDRWFKFCKVGESE